MKLAAAFSRFLEVLGFFLGHRKMCQVNVNGGGHSVLKLNLTSSSDRRLNSIVLLGSDTLFERSQLIPEVDAACCSAAA